MPWKVVSSSSARLFGLGETAGDGVAAHQPTSARPGAPVESARPASLIFLAFAARSWLHALLNLALVQTEFALEILFQDLQEAFHCAKALLHDQELSLCLLGWMTIDQQLFDTAILRLDPLLGLDNLAARASIFLLVYFIGGCPTYPMVARTAITRASSPLFKHLIPGFPVAFQGRFIRSCVCY
jgi:hypothetical protein